MKILFHDVTILTFLSREVKRGDLLIEDDKITAVGGDLSHLGPFDEVIEGHGDILMPTLKNAHAHTAMTFLRNSGHDLPLERWLEEIVFPAEKILLERPEDLIDLTELGILEYLAGGVGAAFEMYYAPDVVLEAYQRMGLRGVMLYQGDEWDRPDFDFEILKQKDGLITRKFGIHALFTQSDERLKRAAKIIQKHHLPFYLHNSETKTEVEESLTRHGLTPTERLAKLGLLNYGGAGFHSIWLSEKDIALYKKHDFAVVSCPGSNALLADGVCPLTAYQKEGLLLALGTDGPASNDALDMFREMHLASVLQKLLLKDPSVGDPYEIMKMATVDAARVMGLEDADVIAVGKAADVILIDTHRPSFALADDPYGAIVYAGARDLVRLTMVNGRILYRDGRYLTGPSPETILLRAKKARERIEQRLNSLAKD